MSNEAFKRNFSAILKRAGEKAEMVARKTMIEMADSMVDKSPVGNPDVWLSLNPYVDSLNQDKGKLVRNKAPAGYVGGRFRANWICALGFFNTDASNDPDASGQAAKNQIREAIASFKAGQTIYVTNSLPYSRALEFLGHSQQAPAGMVRVTVAEYGQYLQNVVASLK